MARITSSRPSAAPALRAMSTTSRNAGKSSMISRMIFLRSRTLELRSFRLRSVIRMSPSSTVTRPRNSAAFRIGPSRSMSMSTSRAIVATSATPPTSSTASSSPRFLPTETFHIERKSAPSALRPRPSPLFDTSPASSHDQRVDFVDPTIELRLLPVPGPRQVDLELRHHMPGPAREHDHAIREVHRLFDGMRDHEDGLRREIRICPQLEDLIPQVLHGEGIQRRERFVHTEEQRLDREGARETHALLHPAAQLAGERVLETGEADGVDELPRAAVPVLRRDALGLEPQLDVLGDREPREERERLKDHRDLRVVRPNRRSLEQHLAGRGRFQADDDPQQGRLSASGRPDDADEVALGQLESDQVEDFELLSVLEVRLRDVLDLEERGLHPHTSTRYFTAARLYRGRQRSLFIARTITIIVRIVRRIISLSGSGLRNVAMSRR